MQDGCDSTEARAHRAPEMNAEDGIYNVLDRPRYNARGMFHPDEISI